MLQKIAGKLHKGFEEQSLKQSLLHLFSVQLIPNPAIGWLGRDRSSRSGRPIQWISLAVLAGALVGCQSPSTSRQDADAVAPQTPATQPTAATPTKSDLTVVATSGVLCDLSQQIAKDTLTVICLIQPGQDPHTFSPSPSNRQAIDKADLILYAGYGLEETILPLMEATKNPAPKIAVFEKAVPNPLMGEAHDHEAHDHEAEKAEHDDHDHEAEKAEHDGHDHESEKTEAALVPDPHVWHDAENGVAIANTISATLSEINPAQTAFYKQNTANLTAQLKQLDGWITAQVTTIPEAARKLITTHEALQYYASAYGFELNGALSGISTEQAPSAAALSNLVDTIKTAQIPTIFAETTSNSDLINTVAKSAGVKVATEPLFVEGPGPIGSSADTYQGMLVNNTCIIVNGLGGRCNPQSAPLQ
jgi:manganese/iron transport system substrate-binding protein